MKAGDVNGQSIFDGKVIFTMLLGQTYIFTLSVDGKRIVKIVQE